MSYAEKTSVPIDRSQAEIKKTLAKYGATSFVYGETEKGSTVIFEMRGRRIRFNLPMPQKPRDNAYQVEFKRWDQKCRSRWRCLCLAIKAKLECVESGITTLEEEFLAHIVLPNGNTVGGWIQPQIETVYKSGNMPQLLIGN